MILTEDPSATLRNDLGVGQPHGNSIHSVREEREDLMSDDRWVFVWFGQVSPNLASLQLMGRQVLAWRPISNEQPQSLPSLSVLLLYLQYVH